MPEIRRKGIDEKPWLTRVFMWRGIRRGGGCPGFVQTPLRLPYGPLRHHSAAEPQPKSHRRGAENAEVRGFSPRCCRAELLSSRFFQAQDQSLDQKNSLRLSLRPDFKRTRHPECSPDHTAASLSTSSTRPSRSSPRPRIPSQQEHAEEILRDLCASAVRFFSRKPRRAALVGTEAQRGDAANQESPPRRRVHSERSRNHNAGARAKQSGTSTLPLLQ